MSMSMPVARPWIIFLGLITSIVVAWSTSWLNQPLYLLAGALALGLALWAMLRPMSGLILFVAILPVEVLYGISFTVTKAGKFGLLLVLLPSIYLYTEKKLPGTRFLPQNRDPLLLPIGLLLIGGCLSTIFSSNPAESVLGPAQYLAVALLYLVLRRIRVTPEWAAGITRTILISAAVVAGLVYLQSLFGYRGILGSVAEQIADARGAYASGVLWLHRGSGTLNNPNAAGASLLLGLAVARENMERTGRTLSAKSLFWWIGGGIICTFSRGAMLAATAVVMAPYILRWDYRSRQTILKVVMLTIVVGGIFSGRRLYDFTSQFLRLDNRGFAIPESRLHAWQEGIHVIERSPIVGVGSYEFLAANGYTDPTLAPERDQYLEVRHPHNGFLKSFAEWGIFGAIGYITLFCTLLACALRGLRTIAIARDVTQVLQRACFLTILGMLATDLFDAGSIVGASSITIALYCMLAIQRAISRDNTLSSANGRQAQFSEAEPDSQIVGDESLATAQ